MVLKYNKFVKLGEEMEYFEAKTLGEAWINSMRLIITSGEMTHDEDVLLKEICNLYITLLDVREDDPIIKEYASKERIELMKQKYFTCGLVGDFKLDYGSYIFNNNGVNQYEWVKERLRNNSQESATISLHRPGEDNLTCLSILDFRIVDYFLIMTAVYRSQNVFASQPGNVIALRKMQKMLADDLNIGVGNFELVVLSAHIYERNLTAAKDILEEYDATLKRVKNNNNVNAKKD